MADVKRYVTPVFRLSFPAFFEAESYQGGEPKYGCSAIWELKKFSDREKKLWRAILGAMDAESKSRFKKALKDLPQNVKKGIRDGAEKADLEGYGDGTKFAALTSKMRPGVIDRDKNAISKDEGNTDEIYPGCYCRATVSIYSYDNVGKGIALGLFNVQKVAEGARLDSRTDASEDFDDDIDDRWLDDGAEDEDDIDF